MQASYRQPRRLLNLKSMRASGGVRRCRSRGTQDTKHILLAINRSKLVLLGIALLMLAACSTTAPTAAPTPNIDATVTAAIQATAAALPTVLPTPTSIPLPAATESPTIGPVATVTPTSIPPTPTSIPSTNTPAPTPTTLPTPTALPTKTPPPQKSLKARADEWNALLQSITDDHSTEIPRIANYLEPGPNREQKARRYFETFSGGSNSVTSTIDVTVNGENGIAVFRSITTDPNGDQRINEQSTNWRLIDNVWFRRMPDPSSMIDALLVGIWSKRYLAANPDAGRYSDKIEFEFFFSNIGNREIRAFTGIATFSDVFGRPIKNIEILYDQPLRIGQPIFWTASWDPNQFIEEDQQIVNTDLGNLIFKFAAQSIIFVDGTQLGSAPR